MFPQKDLLRRGRGEVVVRVIVLQRLGRHRIPPLKLHELLLRVGVPGAVLGTGPANGIVHIRADPVRLARVRGMAKMLGAGRPVPPQKAKGVLVPPSLFGHHVDQARADVAELGAKAAGLDLDFVDGGVADAGVGLEGTFIPERKAVDHKVGLLAAAAANSQPYDSGLKPHHLGHPHHGQRLDLLEIEACHAGGDVLLHHRAFGHHRHLLPH